MSGASLRHSPAPRNRTSPRSPAPETSRGAEKNAEQQRPPSVRCYLKRRVSAEPGDRIHCFAHQRAVSRSRGQTRHFLFLRPCPNRPEKRKFWSLRSSGALRFSTLAPTRAARPRIRLGCAGLTRRARIPHRCRRAPDVLSPAPYPFAKERADELVPATDVLLGVGTQNSISLFCVSQAVFWPHGAGARTARSPSTTSTMPTMPTNRARNAEGASVRLPAKVRRFRRFVASSIGEASRRAGWGEPSGRVVKADSVMTFPSFGSPGRLAPPVLSTQPSSPCGTKTCCTVPFRSPVSVRLAASRSCPHFLAPARPVKDAHFRSGRQRGGSRGT